MTDQALVSVLIRTKDRKALLQETLQSVINQDYPDIEIIIINDGGEDFSAEISGMDKRIRWIENEDAQGRSHAANLALKKAAGDLYLFLDDDDTIDPGHLTSLTEALSKNPEFSIAYSAVRTMTDGKSEQSPSFAHPFDSIRLMIENILPIHAVLFKQSLVDKNIRFDPAFDRYEDWDFWLQLAEQHNFLFVDKCTATYRIDSQSGFGAKEDKENNDVYRAAIYRKWLGRWPEQKIIALVDRSREFPRINVLNIALEEHKSLLADREAFINDLNKWVKEKDGVILNKQEKLAETENALHNIRHDLRKAEKGIKNLESQNKTLESQNKTLESQNRQYKQELEVIYSSKSWKLTKPLRVFTKIQWYIRKEGLCGLFKRILIKLNAKRNSPKKINPEFKVSKKTYPLSFPELREPEISIIIPVFNKYEFTSHCLKSILDNTVGMSYEVIVVDDKSTDSTAGLLKSMQGIKVITNEENSGFIKSCNAGASEAKGNYIVLLNNDTEVRKGWLTALRQTFSDFPDAGLVGARLVFADGKLQEAGGIVWRDGSAWNLGRGEDPNIPEYSYCRQADYCSGACLMLKRDDYLGFGGFDSHYSPAYYEDTDLAFKVRKAGKQVYYQPACTIIHFEGVTSGTDPNSGAKKYQQINHEKFYSRWKDTLEWHRPNGHMPHLEKERHIEKRILVVDARVLMPDHDSGSLRMFNILKILQKLEYKVTFLPANLQYHEKYTPMLQNIGIECQYSPYVASADKYIENNGHQFDAVILSRADYAEKFMDTVLAACPDARILFDTVDLHFLREQREAELSKDQAMMESAVLRKNQELTLARKAHTTLVVSPVEINLFKEEAPDVKVHLLSNVHQLHDRGKNFEERTGILFIGNFEHPPNTDAMEFFLDEIFPNVQQGNPDIRIKIVGGHVPGHLKSRAAANVEFTGFVSDIAPLFHNIRLSIAPLRYGAGVKGKINSSMAYGVPAVVSTMAAEGMNLVHGEDILIADDPHDFAREILRLYEDKGLWESLSDAGRKNIENHFSFAVAENQLKEVLG